MKSRGEGTAVTVTVHVQLSTLHTKHVAQLQPRSAAERDTVTQEDIHVTGVSAAKHSAGSLCGVGRLRAHASLFEELAVCAALRFPTAAAMQRRTASWLRWGWRDRREKGIDAREWSARQACISLERAVTLSFDCGFEAKRGARPRRLVRATRNAAHDASGTGDALCLARARALGTCRTS